MPSVAASPCLVPYALPSTYERTFQRSHPELYSMLLAAATYRGGKCEAGARAGSRNAGGKWQAGACWWWQMPEPPDLDAAPRPNFDTQLHADICPLAGASDGDGGVSWNEVRHWMWPLFTERWGPWRYHRLRLPSVPYSNCTADLPAPPPLLYGDWVGLVERRWTLASGLRC